MHPLKNPLQSNLDCFLLEPDSSPCKNNLSCFSSSLELAPFQDWEKIKERYENEQEAYTALILATQIKESCSEDASSKSFDKDLDSLKNLKISGQNFKHDNHEEESQQEPSVSEDDSFCNSEEAQKKMSLMEDLKRYKYDTVHRQKSSDNNGRGTSMKTEYICGYGSCRKVFLRVWNLLDHLRMHEKVKPFHCSYCDRKFTQKGNLKKHEKQHLTPNIQDRKKFKCDICSSSYTERYNYKAHMRNKHSIELSKNKTRRRKD
ncbi:unnamed protein product [Moneuplotes crassus]|uniref:C2H2-type domain-containing protein n=1 Tax=Euplotes crassus TaxID=5936 RepID=A0AAD1U2V9_EUPCR|nr:unnamed protein product [Moneuplotes crassus]